MEIKLNKMSFQRKLESSISNGYMDSHFHGNDLLKKPYNPKPFQGRDKLALFRRGILNMLFGNKWDFKSRFFLNPVLYLLIISCFLLTQYVPESMGAGTSGSAMLKIGVGAKATSMGEASVAVTDDIASIYWNPAGLVHIKNSQLSAMHIEWFDDVRYEWLGFAQPLSNRVAIAADVSYMYMGSISRTIESTTEGYIQDGTFSPVDMAGRVALSVKAFKNILLGVSVQRIQSKVNFDNVTKEQISDKMAQGFAIDLGGIYNISRISGLSVGACLQNIGHQTKAYFTEKSSMPFAFNMGIAYKIQMAKEKTNEIANDKEPPKEPKTELKSSPGSMIVAADLSFPNDSSVNARIGAEYRFGNGIALRGGYHTGRGSSFPTGLSAGIGYDSSNYQVDYAIVPYGDLGNTHRVSFTIRF